MKIKILESSGWYKNYVGLEFEITHYEYLGFRVNIKGLVYGRHCVITELPESFCVRKSDNKQKWDKYIQWLVKQKNYSIPMFSGFVGVLDGVIGKKLHYDYLYPFGTEIHIDDMIKHIDYMGQHIKGGEEFNKQSQLTVKTDKEFDLTTNEGRLAYARKHYPIGTKYIPLNGSGVSWGNSYIKTINYVVLQRLVGGIEGGNGWIYMNGNWAEIIKQESNMETQKLSRQGLKEIHSIACSSWKTTLEGWGSRNPLEDYIELTQEEINIMFDAADNKQKPILSKYLKQDDGSVDVRHCDISDNNILEIRNKGDYGYKSFWLSPNYNWEIKEDYLGQLCLVPTKKK